MHLFAIFCQYNIHMQFFKAISDLFFHVFSRSRLPIDILATLLNTFDLKKNSAGRRGLIFLVVRNMDCSQLIYKIWPQRPPGWLDKLLGFSCIKSFKNDSFFLTSKTSMCWRLLIPTEAAVLLDLVLPVEEGFIILRFIKVVCNGSGKSYFR